MASGQTGEFGQCWVGQRWGICGGRGGLGRNPLIKGLGLGVLQIVKQIMHVDLPHCLRSKDEVKLFVCEKSVSFKKPFVILKSESRRFSVACPEASCSFSLKFYQRADCVFHVVESTPQMRFCFPNNKTHLGHLQGD